MPTATTLGQIHLSAALSPDEVDLVRDLADGWDVVPGGRALVTARRVQVEEAAAALRRLGQGLLKPMDIQLHGAVVVEDDVGRLAMISARNGRITTRDLWGGGTTTELPRKCAVIDLAVHRAERRVRP